ncbi:unnamed protein product [Lactuca virosa]|uniref:Uncharacterized protein n=1 Tax=Lactuca virosa TaxID=75947 RepID=A0AAU9PSQ1_9ASTR|nr:unnamed protein product [Lactuca virosa]
MKQAERLAFHSKSFDYEIQILHDDAKARHALFMKKANEMKESLGVKVAEIKSVMIEKVKNMEENYKDLHGKVDVLAVEITRLVEFNTKYPKQFQAKLEKDTMVFEKLEEFMFGIKETL